MASGDEQSRSPAVDVIDETLVVASASRVRDLVCDEARWEAILPGLRLSCIEDRGALGKRWSVSGSLEGSAEVWLEPWADAVVVHVFLQADAGDTTPSARASRRLRRRYALKVKRYVLRIKATLEEGRAPGTPRVDSRRH
ncbi:MAG: hypothetical protein ACRDO7_04190 [Nocardioidaceae bacterium]